MKKIIPIITLIFAMSCGRENVNPDTNDITGIAWMITQGEVLYNGYGGVIKYGSDGNEYQQAPSDGSWQRVGTYNMDDTLFSHTSTTGYTYKALYFLSADKRALSFKPRCYLTCYPTNTPEDILIKQ